MNNSVSPTTKISFRLSKTLPRAAYITGFTATAEGDFGGHCGLELPVYP